MELNHRLDGPGEGPPLVLSNSLGTSFAMWEELLPSLAERFRVLRYDQRGHGASPAPAGPYTIAGLAGDLLELLDRLGLEQVSFLGTSMGAMTGMWLALRAPGRIERLALCCTSPRLGPPEMWAERAATVRAEGMEAIVDASSTAGSRPTSAGMAARPSSGRGALSSPRRRRATPAAARRSPPSTFATS